MATRKQRKQLSGGAKMKLAGKKPVLLGLLPVVLDTIRQAAALEMRPVSQFIAFHATEAALRIIAEAAAKEMKERKPS